MNTSLDSLDPVFRPLAFALLARLTEERIPVFIVNTRRTEAEQVDAIARGVSWVKHSKHLDGLAIDVVPYHTYLAHGENKLNWNTTDPIWLRIGQIGEQLGLRWGGRWVKTPDYGHFEYVPPRREEEV